MSSLPQVIPEQTAVLGRADANGNVTIDINWFLFFYNLASQVISPAGGPTSVSSTDLLLFGDDDAPIPTTTTSGAALKICVLGDSLSAQNFILRDAWPAVFQRTMNAADAPCTVVNLAIDGCSFYRALQPVGYTGPSNFVFGTNTMVQECIAQQPVLVLVMLGFNDAITAVDGRNLAQIESDATATFAALRAGLPNAKIVYVSELPYDNVNFTVTASTCNVQTMGVVPYLYQFNASGITSGAYCTSALSNTLSSASNTLLETWFSLDSAIKLLNSGAGVDAHFTMWYWKIARLGCLGPDMLHPTAAGCILENGYIMKGIAALPFVSTLFPKLMNQNYGVWNDPDVLFNTFMFSTGSGYYYNSDGGAGDEWIQQDGCRFQIFPFDESWFLPYHTRFSLSPRAILSTGPPQTYQTQVSLDSGSIFQWTMEHGPPNGNVAISIDGGAFSFLGNVPSGEGFAQGIGTGFSTGLSAGSHTILYRSITGSPATEIYGPFDFVVSAAANAGAFAGLTTSTLAASGQITSSLATGTAPISVTSTTQCTNLNAAAVNGVSFPGATSGSSTGTLVLTSKPGSNSNSVWGALTFAGVTYDFPLFPR